MMKTMTAAALLLTGATASAAPAQWRSHPTFDTNVTHLVDTPDVLYILARPQRLDSGISYLASEIYTLFAFDKEAGEMRPYSIDNYLSAPLIAKAAYNSEKDYLLLVYSDSNIDLLYADGHTVNIPGLMSASLSTGKNVNSITFDPEKSRAYLATDFGYVALNDEKGEIAESRIYGSPLRSAARSGDLMLLLDGDGRLLYAPAYSPRLSLSDYRQGDEYPQADAFLPLDGALCALTQPGATSDAVVLLQTDGSAPVVKSRIPAGIVNVEKTRDGWLITSSSSLIALKGDGSHTTTQRQSDDEGLVASSYDGVEYWFSVPRKGVRSKRLSGESTWTLTRDLIHPDAPAPFIANAMAYTRQWGTMVVNHGYDMNFTGNSSPEPILLSTFKDGEWTDYGPAYLNPEQEKVMWNPIGLAPDPSDPSKVFFGSVIHGIVRLNLDDPQDILHLSRANDPTRNLPGFVEVSEVMDAWSAMCHFSAPKFDSKRTMWTSFNNMNLTPRRLQLWYWPEADRLASTTAASYRPMGILSVEGSESSNFDMLLPLVSNGHSNILVHAGGLAGPITVIDHNGTPDDTSDDRVARIQNKPYDQDGLPVEWYQVQCLHEDTSTGLVWVGTNFGVFTFSPDRIFDAPDNVTRIKVARNDGTGLADYLLNEVSVNCITADDSGRKWFATSGAGIVCTSSDGRTIVSEHTTDTDRMPDDVVYSIVYNPETRSIMASTAKGIAELTVQGGGGGEDSSSVRIMPNPVGPDYYGYVEIDGLPDNALVKIVDGAGSLVKELGRAEGGAAQWDTTNLNQRKVRSGVYYVLVSGPEGSGESNAGKVLIVR